MQSKPILLYGRSDPYHRPVCPLKQQEVIRDRFASTFAENLEDAPTTSYLVYALNEALCEVWRIGAEFQGEEGQRKEGEPCRTF